MRTTDFDFELPVERIAQEPVEPRDAARLLVRDAADGGVLRHGQVRDLPDFLRAGDLLVVNPGSTLFNHTCAILSLPEMAVEVFSLSGKEPLLVWNWGMQYIVDA